MPANSLDWQQITNNWRERATPNRALSAYPHGVCKSFIPLAEQLQDDVARVQCADMRETASASLVRYRRIKLALDTVDLEIFCGRPLACGIVL
jgi:hypothetical protein